jgi:hypothetical protein
MTMTEREKIDYEIDFLQIRLREMLCDMEISYANKVLHACFGGGLLTLLYCCKLVLSPLYE